MSSLWIDLAPDFRQEISQSHYRSDPVKYDLTAATTLNVLFNFRRSLPLPTEQKRQMLEKLVTKFGESALTGSTATAGGLIVPFHAWHLCAGLVLSSL